jgi:DNA-binding transcriptional MerR regulator
MVRLQRILLLRQLGLPLPVVRDVLDGQRDHVAALGGHLTQLAAQRDQLQRQIASVERTLHALRTGDEHGGGIMAQEMFDGFDHTQHRDEVEQRWGAQAYRRSDQWWRGLDEQGRADFQGRAEQLRSGWLAAWRAGEPVDGPVAAALAAQHVDWIAQGWGGGQPSAEALLGLADLYVADERFAAHYGGPEPAADVRDALRSQVAGAGPQSGR